MPSPSVSIDDAAPTNRSVTSNDRRFGRSECSGSVPEPLRWNLSSSHCQTSRSTTNSLDCVSVKSGSGFAVTTDAHTSGHPVRAISCTNASSLRAMDPASCSARIHTCGPACLQRVRARRGGRMPVGARTVGGQGWAHSAYPRTGQRSCEPSREVCPKVARWSPPDALTSTCSAAAVVNTSSLVLIGSPPSATPLRSFPANHASAARCGASGGPAQNSAHASSPSSPGDRRAVSRSLTHLRNSSRVRFEDPVSFSPASRTAWTTGEREDMYVARAVARARREGPRREGSIANGTDGAREV